MRTLRSINIPIDVLRTVATVVEAGSFTKAGDRLGLSQPAISAQMKRFQSLVGGSIFDKAAVGLTLNGRGRLLLPHIQMLLELNDRILAVGGSSLDPRPPRLGMSDMFTDRFLRGYDAEEHGPVSITCGESSEIAKSLVEGHIDVACIYRPPPGIGSVLASWSEALVWARSPTLLVRPGAPIPLVGWPGLLATTIATELLEGRGLSYVLSFTSRDTYSRIKAVEADLGAILLPAPVVREPLVRAREFYLPDPPSIEAAVVVRRGYRILSASLVGLMRALNDSAPQPLPYPVGSAAQLRACLCT